MPQRPRTTLRVRRSAVATLVSCSQPPSGMNRITKGSSPQARVQNEQNGAPYRSQTVPAVGKRRLEEYSQVVPLAKWHAPRLRRASRGLLVVLAGVFACGLLLTSLATATPLPRSDASLPGSLFQGADGNQDDALPLLDWQAREAAGRVIHNPDPNDEDNAFTGGDKENEPDLWSFRTEPDGVDPGKDNILDAWSSFDPQFGDAFLYEGFTRKGALGTTFATFELNHDPRLWNNGQADIPCRHTGDILVS